MFCLDVQGDIIAGQSLSEYPMQAFNSEQVDQNAGAVLGMAALAEGAISAGETVDLLRVVEGLTRTAASIDIVKKFARQEVARAAARLGMEHFFAGSQAARPYDDAAPDGPETDAGL
jgi:hypothetical protein